MATGDEEQGLIPKEDHAERGKKGVNERPSICMIPRVLRDVNKNPFTPMVVSIGPLHRDNVKLQELEGLKDYCLHHLFPSDDLLEECREKVKASMKEIRSYYDAGRKNKYKDASKLSHMMLLDGCFILQFCFDHEKNVEQPTFSNKSQNNYIALDLILLENQIPFFVLQDIFDFTISHRVDISLTRLLRRVLGMYIHPFSINSSDHPDWLEKFSVTDDVSKDDSTHTAHILDCLHKCYHLPKPRDVTAKNEEPAVHSIVELERSGVNFKFHQQGMTIKFKRSPFSCFSDWSWSKPSLLMPKLYIQDFTEVVLRNFIAYEQLFPEAGYYFTSYAFAMDKLIDGQADVGKLVESKVLVTNLGSNKEAADMINSITENIVLVEFYYKKEMEDLDKYYIASLRRTYFNSPWSFIALRAGIILFGLTAVQTIFTVMSYCNHR